MAMYAHRHMHLYMHIHTHLHMCTGRRIAQDTRQGTILFRRQHDLHQLQDARVPCRGRDRGHPRPTRSPAKGGARQTGRQGYPTGRAAHPVKTIVWRAARPPPPLRGRSRHLSPWQGARKQRRDRGRRKREDAQTTLPRESDLSPWRRTREQGRGRGTHKRKDA